MVNHESKTFFMFEKIEYIGGKLILCKSARELFCLSILLSDEV
jgi:hypothetical protein